MTKEKAVSLLSQMFLIQFSKEEHEALAMAINALNIDRKTEPTGYNLSPVDKDINVRSKDEPQTCSVNGRPYDCGNCEYHKCTADEPQTERSE